MSTFDATYMTPSSTRVLWEGTSSTLTSAATGGRVTTASYKITEDGVHFASGMLSTKEEVIPLWAVRDVDLSQSMTQKARRVGDLLLKLDGSAAVYGQQAVKLVSISDPQQVRGLILQQANAIRQQANAYRQQQIIETQRAGASHIGQAPAPAPAPQPAAPSAGDDMMEKLQKLGEMKQAGLLTDEEFTAAKAKLLG